MICPTFVPRQRFSVLPFHPIMSALSQIYHTKVLTSDHERHEQPIASHGVGPLLEHTDEQSLER
jgi:hypothetical protein